MASRADNAELLRQVRERKGRYGAPLGAESIVNDVAEGRRDR